MSTRLHIILSDDLAAEVDGVVEDTESTRSEVIRKALQILIAAHEGKARGLRLGLCHPETRVMETEFIGL